MDEQVARTIANLSDFDQLKRFETNVRTNQQLSRNRQLGDEIAAALSVRLIELGRQYIAQQTGLDLSSLSPAEEKIVRAVSEFAGIRKRQGRNLNRTLSQLENRGLIGAAEASVCKANPPQGYQELADADLEDLSYEQIVLDHPDEFSPRAAWFSRRTLRLPNDTDVPPAPLDGDTQSRTATLLQWLRQQVGEHGGVIPRFTNDQAATVMGMGDMRTYGRVVGNIQSRIDFACYRCGLPPLGLTAWAPFADAWAQQERDWAFPVPSMQVAAQLHIWSNEEFDRILGEVSRLPGQAHRSWKDALSLHEAEVKAWAFGLAGAASQLPVEQEVEAAPARNPRWTRDELILALDLYLRHRESPPAKDSPEIIELSEFLNALGRALGVVDSETYRNANGVYMKMMNFRRFDPEYIKDGKVGLTRGNKDEQVVWDEFSSDQPRLESVVFAIRSAIASHSDGHELEGIDEPDIQEAEEGRVLTRMHRVRERSRKLVEAKKNDAVKRCGKLVCEACGFDFAVIYGAAGDGIIDIHHTKPVYTLKPGDTTKLDDLALLCANCHRMVHSSRPWRTVEQVRALIQTRVPTP